MIGECFIGKLDIEKGSGTLRHTKLPQNLNVSNHGFTVKGTCSTLKNCNYIFIIQNKATLLTTNCK
jgi:hypothetical protein